MLEAFLCQLHVRFDKLDFPCGKSMKVWKSNRGTQNFASVCVKEIAPRALRELGYSSQSSN